jgi:hypothetical protein
MHPIKKVIYFDISFAFESEGCGISTGAEGVIGTDGTVSITLSGAFGLELAM